jgi:hypothetical protein
MFTPPSRARRAMLALACVAGTALGAAGCSSSWEIHRAQLSSDERTLTVQLVFGAPDSTGKFCERVTDTEVTESPSQVIVGVEVDASCRRSWPWEDEFTNLVGHVYPVPFELKQPLGERTVIDNEGHQPVTIIRETTVTR